MRRRVDSLINGTLTVAVCIIAMVLLRREFFSRPSGSKGALVNARPAFLSGWERLVDFGIRDGAPGSRVTVLQFSDLECPFCRSFHATLRAIQGEFGADVSTAFVHFPLSSHRFARPAAKALECAAQQRNASRMTDVLFQYQDSLGLQPWSWFALQADISSITGFDRCVADTSAFARIERGRFLAESLQLSGTPTVVINGWRLPEPPDSGTLHDLVVKFLKDSAGTSFLKQ